MEYLLIKRDTLVDIADAIRYKKESSSLIPTLDMATEIRSIPGGVTTIETVLGSSYLLRIGGISGTSQERELKSITMAAPGKIVFHPDTYVKTNTGSNEGYFDVRLNGTSILKTYCPTDKTALFPVPEITVQNGDVVTIIGGFDNYHTSCWFEFYSTITIIT